MKKKKQYKGYTAKQVTAISHLLGLPGGTSEIIVAAKLTELFGFAGGKRKVINQYLSEKPAVIGIEPFVPKCKNFVYGASSIAGEKQKDKTVSSPEFLSSYEWRKVRLIALKRDGAKCACCGATPASGAVMNVDHIKPRKFFPELALDPDNLQVLCHECNHGIGNWDQTDFRINR